MKQLMKKQWLVMGFLVMLAMPSFLQAQGWEKKFSFGTAYNDAFSICQTKDSAYWAVGASEGPMKQIGNLIKLDKNGNKIFNQFINDTYLGIAVKPFSDQGVLTASLYENAPDDIRLIKFDKNGTPLWEHNISGGLVGDFQEVANEKTLWANQETISLYNKNGVSLWTKSPPTISKSSHFTIQFYDDNHFFISGILPNGMLTEFDYDYNGNLLGTKDIYQVFIKNGNNLFKRDTDGSYLYLENIIDNGLSNSYLYRLKDKQLIWTKIISNGSNKLFDYKPYDFIIDKTGNIVLHGIEAPLKEAQTNSPTSKVYAFIMVLDNNGKFKSMQRYGENFANDFSGLCESYDNYYVACGWSDARQVVLNSNNHSSIRIVKTKANLFNTVIFGKIVLDTNANCLADSLENKQKNWLVVAKSNNNTELYGTSDNNGNYQIFTDTGTYKLKLQNLSPYHKQVCDSVFILQNNGTNTIPFNLLVRKTIDCYYLNVNIANRALRPCFPSVQVVNFCNKGTATATNAYVKVKLDPNLTYETSSIAGTLQSDGTYRFDLGNIPVDSCGQFTITTKVACDNSLLGKTLCNKAHIYPDSICTDNLGKIQVIGTCNGNNTIQFDIKNESDKAMQNNKNYIIIEDDVMYMQGNFKLNPNEVKPITVQAKAGKTYRLIAEQTNPIYGGIASAALENCNASASASTGFINQFPLGDDSPFEDEDCRVVSASYDPNDKQAFPEGVKNQHFIAKNTDLEYMIRFQNTGTDTAFLVVLRDTLSSFLDPATIEPGASSHPYKFDLTDRGIAKFTFWNINLPHEKADKEGSNGFVKFRIKQKRDLPNNTVIKNKAAIYFDYNDPIITNTTTHTIGENWLQILPTNDGILAKADIKIYPNPFNESTKIEIIGTYNNLKFNILDLNGRILRSESFEGNSLDFHRNGLSSGLYIYQITSDGIMLQNGKIVVE